MLAGAEWVTCRYEGMIKLLITRYTSCKHNKLIFDILTLDMMLVKNLTSPRAFLHPQSDAVETPGLEGPRSLKSQHDSNATISAEPALLVKKMSPLPTCRAGAV